MNDAAWLLDHVRRLSDRNEAGRAEPWSVDDAPPDYIAGLVKAIVGLQLRVDHIDGAWKFVQHHPEENRRGVRQGLASSGNPAAHALAAAMEAAERTR